MSLAKNILSVIFNRGRNALGEIFACFALLALMPAGTLMAANPAQTSLSFRVDTIAPDSISDLVVQTATGTESSVILNWTEPGNDGMAGQAQSYLVRISTDGNINNNADFSTATVYNSGWSPGSGGGLTAQMAGSLVPGQTYYWAIQTRDAAGHTAPWSRAGVNPNNFAVAWDSPPATVSGAGISAGNEQISVSWTDLSLAGKTTDFDFYRLYRSTMPTFAPEAVITTTTSTSYLDTSIVLTTYYYRVLGADKGWNSTPTYPGNSLESVSWSTVSAKPLLPAPTNFSVQSASTESITWQWVDNATMENGFNIYSSTGIIASTGTMIGRGTTVQWTEASLIPGTSYQRYVVATETNTVSSASSAVIKYTLPNPPLALESSTQTAQTATLNWNANNNGPFVQYILERATYPSVTFTPIAGVIANVFISTGLAEGTTYTYQLKARNGENSESSVVQLTTTTPLEPPATITSLTTLAGPQEGTLALRWLSPGDDGTAGSIIGGLYDIRWSTGEILSPSDFDGISAPYQKLLSTTTAPGRNVSAVITGLTVGNLYYFAMKTRDEIPLNYSGMSNIVSAYPQFDVVPPASVTSFVAARSSNTAALLTWIAPGDDGTVGNNAGGAYDIRYSPTPIQTPAQFAAAQSVSAFGTIPAPGVVGSSEAMTLAGLALDSTYYFALRASDDLNNNSGLSNPTTIYTPDLVAPDPVQGFTAAPNYTVGGRIDLAWTNPSNADLRGLRLVIKTDGFALTHSTVGVSYLDFSASSGVLTSTHAHIGLAPGVTYYYSLFAFDDTTPANFSSGVTASTVAPRTVLIAPSKPKNVRSARSGQNFIVTWTTPTTRADGSLLGAGELASYKVFKTQAMGGATVQMTVLSASTASFTDALTASIYYYRLRAVNVAGQESEDSDYVSTPEEPDSDGDVYIMMDNYMSYLKVPSKVIAPLYQSNVDIAGARQSQEEGGKVFKSLNLYATNRLNNQLMKDVIFDRPVHICIGYVTDSVGMISNGAPAMAFTQPLPSAADAPNSLSAYWNNGSQWIKLGTEFDTVNNKATIRTRHLGGYQLRLVSQAAVQGNSVFPRTITPNGDGANDMVFFFFENKTGAQASGNIYDMRSAKVGTVKESNIFVSNTTVLTWDGKDGSGAVVPGGVYIYKIEVGGETFTGTVVVAK